MNPINTSAELKATIQQLELKRVTEYNLLKEEVIKTSESLKLINIIKSTFNKVATAPDLKTDIINAAVGLTTGIVAKKVIIGKTLNPLSKLLGVMLEVFVANKVTKNAGEIKSLGGILMKKIFNQHTDPEVK
ncbi:MAG TPA: hypothetical protein PKC54_06540 [Ferruginibacter sp.]|nr:hypothetical protein [Ferruginibacter sp.]